MKAVVSIVALLSAGLAVAWQTPSFEAASVKPAQPMDGRMVRISMGGDPGRINYQNVSLKQLVTRAYGVKDYQVSGPGWLDQERYDLTATMPENTAKETAQLMLQNLLAERFQLKVHREDKEVPGFALVVGKGGPKLKPSSTPTLADGGPQKKRQDSGTAPAANTGPRRGIMMMPGKIEASDMDLDGFANLLATLTGRPVLDMTGLKGSYDCSLTFTPDASLGGPVMMKMAQSETHDGAPESSGPSLFTALQEQLGLKLEARKTPLEIVVVDSAAKIPTEN